MYRTLILFFVLMCVKGVWFMKFLVMSLVGLLLLTGTAQAFDWSLKVEPGFSIPITSPQSQLFNVGGALTVKALIELGPYFDAGPTIGFMGLPASDSNVSSDMGIGWQLGGGIRFKVPHTSNWLSGVSPWLDADGLYTRTGALDRFGFSTALGFSFPIDDQRKLWLGPYVRYNQIVQPERLNYDNSDAKVITIGLSIEVGSARRRVVIAKNIEVPPVIPESMPVGPVAIPVVPVEPVVEPVQPAVADTVIAPTDPCPGVNCPDTIDFKEHIRFKWDQFNIEPDMYPVLDKVVADMKSHKRINLVIEGHASVEGSDTYNQNLSENRAKSVLNYLITNGVPEARLTVKGFGSSVSLESNKTAKGRESNRRVVFKAEIVLDRGN